MATVELVLDAVPTVASIEADYLKEAARVHKRMVLQYFCDHNGCWELKAAFGHYCSKHRLQYRQPHFNDW